MAKNEIWQLLCRKPSQAPGPSYIRIFLAQENSHNLTSKISVLPQNRFSHSHPHSVSTIGINHIQPIIWPRESALLSGSRHMITRPRPHWRPRTRRRPCWTGSAGTWGTAAAAAWTAHSCWSCHLCSDPTCPGWPSSWSWCHLCHSPVTVQGPSVTTGHCSTACSSLIPLRSYKSFLFGAYHNMMFIEIQKLTFYALNIRLLWSCKLPTSVFT